MRIRRYTSMIWLHWATALLVAASFAIAWIRKDIDDLDSRAFWLDVHRSIGLVILVLTLVRLAWRFRVGALSHRADLPPAMWLASRVTHGLIYASLIAMPVIGWAQSSAAARHLKLFGSPFPALVGHDRDLADTLAAWHENVGWAFIALIGLHALAAIYHHCVRRDDLLRAMLPGYKPPVVEPALPGTITASRGGSMAEAESPFPQRFVAGRGRGG